MKGLTFFVSMVFCGVLVAACVWIALGNPDSEYTPFGWLLFGLGAFFGFVNLTMRKRMR